MLLRAINSTIDNGIYIIFFRIANVINESFIIHRLAIKIAFALHLEYEMNVIL